MSWDEHVKELIRAVTSVAGRNCDEVDGPLEELLTSLREPLPLKDCEHLLGTLRASRCFNALSRAADELIQVGANYPYVQRQYAQALIENGQVGLASSVLGRMLETLPSCETEEKSEALGLLGRTHKQQFVKSSKSGNSEKASEALKNAISCYQRAYSLNPAWHGANLVALSHRAEREGIGLGPDIRSWEAAQVLLEDLNKLSEAKWNPWTFASAGEAHLALEEWEKAKYYYGRFAQHKRLDGFAVGSAARQLREIWGYEVDSEAPPGRILAALQTLTLSTPCGGEFESSPREMSRLSETLQDSEEDTADTFEAILGENRTVPIQVVLKLIEVGACVCQVVDRELQRLELKSGGTGFLVDGQVLHERWAGSALLVTNHHVLSEDGQYPSVEASHADAIFHYWEGKPNVKTFAISEILKYSDRHQLDFTIARLRPHPDLKKVLERFSLNPHALGSVGIQPPRKVYVIGHPDGRGLEFSLSDNIVLDHQLLDSGPLDCRCIHYKAPTEKGMSGSPVLSQKFEVVGLHRKGGKVTPLRKLDKPEEYRANEAVWAKSILDAM